MDHHDEIGQLMVEVGGVTTYSVKTLIIDAADNWGGNRVAGREFDLVSSGSRLPLVQADYTASATSFVSASFAAKFMFDTSLSLLTTDLSTSWKTSTSFQTNQRIYCLYDNIQSFEEMLFNNYHFFGTATNLGMKNVKIYVTEQTFQNTVFEQAVPGGTLIFDGVLPEHSAVNEVQDYNIPLI